MADTARLLSSTEDELKSIAAEIKRLEEEAQTEKQNYLSATRGEKTALKAVWEAAVRREEAASRASEALRAEKKALIEKLPAAGELSVKSKMLIQIPQHKHDNLARASIPDCLYTDKPIRCRY